MTDKREKLKVMEAELLAMWERDWSDSLPVRPYPFCPNVDSPVWFVGTMPSTAGEKLRLTNPDLPNYAATKTDEMFEIKRVGFGFADAYLTDIVKAGARRGRSATARELHAFWPFLQQELTLLNPRLILAMGKATYELLWDIASSTTVVKQITHPAAAFGNGYQRREQAFDSDLAAAREVARELDIV